MKKKLSLAFSGTKWSQSRPSHIRANSNVSQEQVVHPTRKYFMNNVLSYLAMSIFKKSVVLSTIKNNNTD